MSIVLHLSQLEKQDVHLDGEKPTSELELDLLNDELMTPSPSFQYDIHAELLGPEILVQGSVSVPFKFECARCLKPFDHTIELNPWSVAIPVKGEESPKDRGDSVDLAPWIREDVLLALPQHPVCSENCVVKALESQEDAEHDGHEQGAKSDVWNALNNLKL